MTSKKVWFTAHDTVINKVCISCQILSVEAILSLCMQMHARVLATRSLIYTQLKMGSQQRLEADEDSTTEQKTWRVYSFGKRKDVTRSTFCLEKY